MSIRTIMWSLLLDDGAAVLAEYALVLGLLSMGAITVLATFATRANFSLQQTTSTQLGAETSPP